MKSEKIYKFYGYRDFDLDALAGSYFWFSKASDFNDPFEGLYIEQLKFRDAADLSSEDVFFYLVQLAIYNGVPEGDAIKQAQEKQKSLDFIPDSFRTNPIQASSIHPSKHFVAYSVKDTSLKTINSIKSSKFCCFIRDYRDCPALKNKLMWSHYANGLRGFAIEFDTKSLYDSMNKHNSFEIQGGYVNYKNLKVLDSYQLLMDYFKNRHNSGIASVVLTKSPEWKYEQEFRLLSDSNKNHYDCSAINSIILGQKMQKEKLSTLLAIIESLGLMGKVKVATIDKDTFNLNVVDFNSGLFD